MNGIDVSERDGVIDWAGAYAEGVEFALVRASVGLCADACFAKNVLAAQAAGIAVGVYHDLLADAVAESAVFLSLLAPYRDKITLWAACRTEEDPAGACAFLDIVDAAGFSPMLASPPQVLKRLSDAGRYPLWLLFWGASEARALSYCPTVWQYGAGRLANLAGVNMNRGYCEGACPPRYPRF